MIGYVTVETTKLDRAILFYNNLLGSIGAVPCVHLPRQSCMYGVASDQPMFGVVSTRKRKASSRDSGTVVAFRLNTRNDVDRLHELAISLGAKIESCPADREGRNDWYYETIFRDLDGHRICAYFFGSVDDGLTRSNKGRETISAMKAIVRDMAQPQDERSRGSWDPILDALIVG